MPVFSRPGSCLFGRSGERAVADEGPLPDHDLLVEDRAVDDGAGADDRVEHDDRVAHDRPDAHAHARRQHRVHDRAVDDAAVADQASMDLGRGPDLGRRAFLGSGVDDPVLVVQVELGVVVQERHVGLPVRLDRPDVLPVAVVAVAEDPGAGVDHRRDDVAAEVDVLLGEPAPQGLLREDVDAHRREVALGLLGLLLPLDDAVLLVHREDPHPGRLGEGHPPDRDRDVGAVAAMGGKERLVVHLVDVVAGEDQHGVARVVLDDVDVAQHRVGGPAIPLRHAATCDVRLEQLHAAAIAVEVPRPAQPDVVVERARVVLRQHDDVVDLGVDAVREREVDDPVLATERHGRLGAFLRQDGQPLAFAACEDDCHRSLHASRLPWHRAWTLLRPCVDASTGHRHARERRRRRGVNVS